MNRLITALLATAVISLGACAVPEDSGSTSKDHSSTTVKSSVEKGTPAQENALRSAQDYLSFQGFSRAGLIDQLSSKYGDGYDRKDATWAVNHLDVDWNKQAVRAGRDYLSLQGFSRQGLIDQLSSEYGDQFTVAQATYAADKLGL